MPLSNRWIAQVQLRIDALRIGDIFALEDLMEDVWEEMAEDMNSNANGVGRMFASAVRRELIHNVRETVARTNPRASMWQKNVENSLRNVPQK